MSTTSKTATALWIAINLVCASVTTGSTADQLPARRVAPVVVVDEAEPVAPASDATVVEEAVVSEPTTMKLRRVRGHEVTPGLVKMAKQIVHEHHKKPFGTDIHFELDGTSYVGRIEQHYHPPGGAARPWGYHPGCSLFIEEPAN